MRNYRYFMKKFISIIFIGIILSLQEKVKSHEIKFPTYNYHCPKFGNISITAAKARKRLRDWGSDLEYITVPRGNKTLEFDALIDRGSNVQSWNTTRNELTYRRSPYFDYLPLIIRRNFSGIKTGIYKCKFIDKNNSFK